MKTERKTYTEPYLDVILISESDLIATSGGSLDFDGTGSGGPSDGSWTAPD